MNHDTVSSNETFTSSPSHEPVMLNEVLSIIETHSTPKHILDGTLGLGGYSEAMLAKFPDSHILGIDRDEQAITLSLERLKQLPEETTVYPGHGYPTTISHEKRYNPFL